MSIRALFVAASVFLIPLAAFADEARRLAGAPTHRVVVWRSDKAMSDGRALLAAKADVKLILPLVACTPLAGARIVISDGGFFSSSIIVIDGDSAGCRGVIPNEDMAKR